MHMCMKHNTHTHTHTHTHTLPVKARAYSRTSFVTNFELKKIINCKYFFHKKN